MPRFFFNIADNVSSLDQDGTDLPDLHSAQAEAVRFMGDLLQEQGRGFAPISPIAIDVIDEEGVRVLRVEVGLIHRGSSQTQPDHPMAPFLT